MTRRKQTSLPNFKFCNEESQLGQLLIRLNRTPKLAALAIRKTSSTVKLSQNYPQQNTKDAKRYHRGDTSIKKNTNIVGDMAQCNGIKITLEVKYIKQRTISTTPAHISKKNKIK